MLPRPSSDSAAFSLVEMLAVVALIAVMAVLVIPAVSGFGRSAAMTSAGTLVTNLATLARQDAMSKNTVTALVMLADEGTPQDFRSFTVLEYHLNQGWWQIANWETLPDGVIVDRSDSVNSTFLLHSPDPFPFNSALPGLPVPYHGTAIAAGSAYAARIFTPTGRLQNAEFAAQIRLVEGYLKGHEIVYTHRKDASRAANYCDIAIVGATGNTKVSRP